jgi:hypothetical protein
LIDDLKGSEGQIARKELANLQAQEKAITDMKNALKRPGQS